MPAHSMEMKDSPSEARDVSLAGKRSWRTHLLLQHAHPMKLTLDALAFCWFIHFLWTGEWLWAIGAVVLLPVIGSCVAMRADPSSLAATPLGRYFIEVARPRSLSLLLVGFAVITLGVWAHGTFYILLGASILALGYASAGTALLRSQGVLP